MTEDEARAKTCCGPEGCGHKSSAGSWAQYARDGGTYSEHQVAALTQLAIANAPRVCIGSACMAWRRDTRPISGYIAQDGTSVVTQRGPDPEHGYCGLAGRP